MLPVPFGEVKKVNEYSELRTLEIGSLSPLRRWVYCVIESWNPLSRRVIESLKAPNDEETQGNANYIEENVYH